jgi:hypothetical protein
VSALTNTPTSKATQDRQERLAQLGARVVEALREASKAGADGWSIETVRGIIVDRVQSAALALGLLGEGEARRTITDCTCARGGNAATCECREGEARP